MSNWKISPSRTALGVALTAAALATSIGASAAPIKPENDDALFKLRYAGNAKASTAARDAINRAILPLIDASAVDEYTLEPLATMPMEMNAKGPLVSGSIGPVIPSGEETIISMEPAFMPMERMATETIMEAPVRSFAPAMDYGRVETTGMEAPIDFGPIQTAPIMAETMMIPAPEMVTSTHSAIDCGGTIATEVMAQPYLGPIETFAQETVEFVDTTPIVQAAPQIIQTAPQTITCPTPAPVAQPTTTVINITPPSQQVAPVFQAAPQQVAEVAPAFIGGFGGGFIGGGGGFGGGSVSSSQTVVVEGGGGTVIDNRSVVDNSDNRVFNDNSVRTQVTEIFNEGDRVVNQGDRVVNQGDRVVNQGDRIVNQGDRVTNNNEFVTNNTKNVTNNDNRTTNNEFITNNTRNEFVTNNTKNVDNSQTVNNTNVNNGATSSSSSSRIRIVSSLIIFS